MKKFICSHCKGNNVLRDAFAAWDESAQDWVLENVYDYAYCPDCEGETTIKEIEEQS